MTINLKGKCSWFGGPDDTGVAADEGLAFIYTVEDKEDLFLSYQPDDTTGLARRLNPAVPYVACRWYAEGNPDAKAKLRPVLLTEMALVTAKKNGRQIKCYPADWGPHEDTKRIADISQGAMDYLQIETDDEVEVVFPFTERGKVHIPRYKRICISSGHSLKCQGANGYLNEVEEATRVTDILAVKLRQRGVEVETFHDLTSTSQNQNLQKITDWHNDQDRELDLSVHFNASQQTNKPMGTEMWYITQQALAHEMSTAIASVGFKNRGAKWSDSLWFLNQTMMPSVLLEICFVDSTADADLYHKSLNAICEALATVLSGHEKRMIAGS